MKDIGRMIGVVFLFMSIYYLILFFRIGKCISAIERIEKKLDSIRQEGKRMIDYLNPHHVYIDAQAAPDLSMEVKRAANIIPEKVDTLHNSARTDAERGAKIMDNRINTLYGAPDETQAERIIRLYRSGMSHVDIAQRGYDLAEVRRVISEATRVDETLYQTHKGIESRWSKRSATGGEQ